MLDRLLRHLMSDSRFEPPDVDPEPNEDLNIHIYDRNDDSDLFAYMDGGEIADYHTPSQTSSDISLSNVGSGKLPSSCDTMTRTFWPDDLDQTYEYEEENGHENEG